VLSRLASALAGDGFSAKLRRALGDEGVDDRRAHRRSGPAPFSLISLAILPKSGRYALLGIVRAVQARCGTVAYDGNYSPSHWNNAAEAHAAHASAVAACTIGPPTLEDEVLL
jgi:2-dehydro-3-deoxygluconokinase